jgi:hypothetical protein
MEISSAFQWFTKLVLQKLNGSHGFTTMRYKFTYPTTQKRKQAQPIKSPPTLADAT